MRFISNYAFRRLADNHSPQQKLSGARLGLRPAMLRRVSVLLAFCFLWSLILVPSLSAAVPHSSARQRAGAGMFLLQTQAKKMALLQAHLSRFPYQLYAAQRTRPGQTPVLPPAADLSAPQTLLDEAGRLARTVAPATVASWKQELNTARPAADRVAQLHLWLGEWALAANKQPKQADWHFRAAMHATGTRNALHGRAAYDRALTLFYHGAYADATDAFQALLLPKTALRGYNRRICALWYRQASACASYHEEHAKLGIPEPPSLDPECGAASLAAALRGLGRPSDRKTVLAGCKVTGEGSSLQDLVDAARTLKVTARAVTADDAGLMQLPKPLVAYVERDHFIAVVRADKTGVSYLCSDCGPWPGGQVNLTWKQWHSLDPGLYAVASLPGSGWDKVLAALPAEPSTASAASASRVPAAVALEGAPAVRVASLRLTGLRPSHIQILLPSLRALRGHVFRVAVTPGIICGSTPVDPQDPPDNDCANDTGGEVNLSMGQEDHNPVPDLTVYNPHGPSVMWSRRYQSLRGNGQGYNQGDPAYQCNDFGPGWTQTYNVGVVDSSGGTAAGVKSIFFENGGRDAFIAPAVPSSINPVVHCASQRPGTPMLLDWNYDGSTGGHYTVTFQDRTKWVTGSLIAAINCYPLARIVDRNGHALTFNYGTPASGYAWPLLSSITNEDGTALLTLQRATDGTGNLVSLQDCYRRMVFYHDGLYSNSQVPKPWARSMQLLDRVSQIVPTGTNSTPPDRYVYAYQMVSNSNSSATVAGGYELVPYLHTCSVPSPTGSGVSTYTWNYDPQTGFVSSESDGNGNIHRYTYSDGTHTQVTVTDAAGTVVAQQTYGFNSSMSAGTRTDNAGTVTSSPAYSDPNSWYQPSSVTDGNGKTTQYTHDQFGNMTSQTSPRGTKTVHTYDYSRFALGELVSEQEGSKTATTYAYIEPSGLVQTVNTPQPGTTGTGATVTISYTYDGLGNLLTETTPGNNAVASITTTYNYTTDGSYSQPTAIGQPLTVTDNLGKITHMRWDTQGNMFAATDALGNETDTSFNLVNQPIQTTFPATGQQGTGRASTLNAYLYPGGPLLSVTSYDESGAAIRQVNYASGQEGEARGVSGSDEPVTYTYDALYRLSSLTDGGGHTTRYFYNAAGYLYQTAYPGTGTTSAPLSAGSRDTVTFPAYDGDGHATRRIDGNGVETDYTHNADPESLLTQVHYVYPAGYTGGTVGDVFLAYDQYGRRQGMTDSTGSQSYTYDDGNNPLSGTTAYTGLPAKTLSYGYYPDGSRQMLTTPAGAFSYAYDKVGRMAGLTNPYSEVSSWQYLDNDWISNQTLGNGAITTYTYNALGQQINLASKKADGTSLSELSVPNVSGYDGVGNRAALTANRLTAYNGMTTYQYDAKNQLTQEVSTRNGSYTNAFGYDAVGNLTTFKGQGHTYNADNQDSANSYDGNGNPVVYGSNTLSFDPENRMIVAGNVLTVGYRGDGLRAWKQNSSSRTYFLYDGDTPVCELDGSGNATATNTFSANGLVSRHMGNGSIFYTFDSQGNVAQRLDGSASILSSDLYDAFGNRLSTAGIKDVYGFGAQNGYYTDTETGLQLLDYRYYDPKQGRFLTRDPISYAGGVNLYGYVRNRPTSLVDPSGLRPCDAAEVADCIRRTPTGSKFVSCTIVDLNFILFVVEQPVCHGRPLGPARGPGGGKLPKEQYHPPKFVRRGLDFAYQQCMAKATAELLMHGRHPSAQDVADYALKVAKCEQGRARM